MDEHSDIMKFDDELKTIMKLYQADPVSESCVDKEIEQLRLSIDKKREQKDYDFSVVNTFNIYDDPTTTDLVRLAQENNELAYAELFRKYYRVAYRLCMKISDSAKIDIDYMVSKILIQLFSRIPKLKNPEDFHALFHPRVISPRLSCLRSNWNFCRKYKITDTDSVKSEASQRMNFDVDMLRDALKKLNADDKDMILLRADGFSYKEISQILNVSPKYVASRLHRIRKNLIKSMDEEEWAKYVKDYDLDE